MGIIKDGSDEAFKRAKAGIAESQMTDRPRPGLPKSAVLQGAGRNAQLYAKRLSEKQASMSGGGGGADLRFGSPEIRNPLLNLINFYLPYDRRTLNQWIRYYDKFQPVVGNCMDLHGEFPISDFHFINLEDKAVQDVYEQFKEDVNLIQWCFEVSREYELIGECFTFWNWDDELGSWSEYVPINPDLLDVKTLNWGYGKETVFTYEPPAELKQLISDRDPRVQQMLLDLDPVVYENVRANKRIPLSDFNVTMMMRKSSPYETRGTSIMLRILKELMYEDKIREAQYAIADQQITPVQLWKIGDPASGYMPTDGDLDDFRQLLLAGAHDPLFTIVSHGAVNLDLIGFTGKLLPVIPEFEWVTERILIGLFASKGMMTGDGGTYSNSVVAMKALQGRYESKRDKIGELIRKKLLEPIAKAQKFYDTTPAELAHRVRTRRKLKVPDIEWNFKLDLTDEAQRIGYLMQLREKTDISMKVLCAVLDIDYEQNKAALSAEQGTVYDPVYRAAREARADEGATPSDTGGGMGGGAPGTSFGGAPGAEAAGAGTDGAGEEADTAALEVPV